MIKKISNKQTTNMMKLGLYQIHVQRKPIILVINSLKINKSSLYRYEKILDDEVNYCRTFFLTYKKKGKEKAYLIMFEKLCNRKNMDKNLLLALNDIFINENSIGTTISKYDLSRSTIYRRVDAVKSEIHYLRNIKKLIKHSKSYKVKNS